MPWIMLSNAKAENERLRAERDGLLAAAKQIRRLAATVDNVTTDDWDIAFDALAAAIAKVEGEK